MALDVRVCKRSANELHLDNESMTPATMERRLGEARARKKASLPLLKQPEGT